MGKSEFSESSYGQVVTAELMSRYHAAVRSGRIRRMTAILVADIPSLRQEALIGYDVMFPFPEASPLCFQYKLSAELSARKYNSVTKKKVPTGAVLQEPAYEFEVRKDQNETLQRLQSQILVKAFYCAPKFWRSKDLNRYAGSDDVLKNSFLLAPPRLPERGNKHIVYFDLTKRNHYICSEPRKLDGVYEFENLIESLYPKQSVRDLLEEILQRLKEDLVPEKRLWDRVDASLIAENRFERAEPLPPYYWRSAALYRWVRRIIYQYYGADFHLV